MKNKVLRGAAVAAITLWLAMSGALAGDAGRMQFRIGGFLPDGDDAFWSDVENTFTLDVSEFDDLILGVSFVHPWGDHFEVGFNVDLYDNTVVSAVDGFVDGAGLPILHDTNLTMLPVSMDFRVLPFGHHRVGKSRQSYRPVLYLGGGIGSVFWEYEEIGEFVDFTTDEIFFDHFVDEGVAFATHALAGIELPFSSGWGVMMEVKRTWADDTPGGDFGGLGKLDLGGTTVSAGATLRF